MSERRRPNPLDKHQWLVPFYAKIQLLAHKWLGADWEDAAHEICLHIIENGLPEYDPNQNLAGWVYRVALHKIYDLYRRRVPEHRRRPLIDIDAFIAPLEMTPAEREEQTQRLVEALKHLEPDENEVIVSHYFADLPFDQIAQNMGISVRSVYRKQADALPKLRRML